MVVNQIRDIFAYADRFQGQVFVIQIDYDIIAHDSFPVLLQDIVLLQQIGIRVVLVPGARRHIDEVLERYGISSTKKNGVRVSSPEAIPFIKMAAFDAANRVMTLLSRHAVTGIIGNWVRSRGLGVIDGVDFEASGRVDSISIDLIQSVLDDGLVPIFPCIGWSITGRPYNISSVELASRLSIDLSAAKLFYLVGNNVLVAKDFSLPKNVFLDDTGRISRLYPDQARALLSDNTKCDEGLRFVLEGAVQACEAGVERAHLVDGRLDGVMLEEIFTNRGAGTMIHRFPFESMRPLKESDIPAVIRLMQPAMEQGILVQRSINSILKRLQDYVVFAADQQIVGCGALHAWGEDSAEIAALASDVEKGGTGVGNQILQYLIKRAETQGFQRLFVLTTQ